MSDHVWWVNLVSAKGMRNPTQTLSWCAVQISFLHIYLWKRTKTTTVFSPRQLLHGSASLQGKLLIWNCLIFRSLKPTCQFWQSYYIIFDILLQLDSLVCQNVQSQENTRNAQDLYVAAEGEDGNGLPMPPCLVTVDKSLGLQGLILASHYVQGPTQRFHVVIRLRIAKHASSWEYGENWSCFISGTDLWDWSLINDTPWRKSKFQKVIQCDTATHI